MSERKLIADAIAMTWNTSREQMLEAIMIALSGSGDPPAGATADAALRAAATEMLRLYDLTAPGAKWTRESLNVTAADVTKAAESLRAALSGAAAPGDGWLGNPPHRCRDGHVPIGHWDSEHEICPLCRATATVDLYAEKLAARVDSPSAAPGDGRMQCHDCAHFGPRACDVPTCVNFAGDNVAALDAILGRFGVNFASIRRQLAEHLDANGARLGSPSSAPGTPVEDAIRQALFEDEEEHTVILKRLRRLLIPRPGGETE